MDAPLYTSVELLDLLRAHLGTAAGQPEPVTDYRVAKVLDVRHATVSGIRTGKQGWGDESCLKIAEILGFDPQYVLACCYHERAVRNTQNDRLLSLWARIARTAAMFLFGVFILTAGAPHEAWAAGPGGGEQLYTLCAPRGRRRSRLLGQLGRFLGVVWLGALAACSVVAPAPDPAAAPYQAEAARQIDRWNARHGTELAVPDVLVMGTQPLAAGEDHCFKHYARYYSCYLVLSSQVVATRPDYALHVLLPHELGHDICVLTVPGCTANDHGPAWRAIALELGLDPQDAFIIRPELGAAYHQQDINPATRRAENR